MATNGAHGDNPAARRRGTRSCTRRRPHHLCLGSSVSDRPLGQSSAPHPDSLLKAFPSYRDSPKVLPQPGAVCSQPPGGIENCLTHLATMEFAASQDRAGGEITGCSEKKPRHPNWGQGVRFARDRRLRQAERRGFDPILSQNSVRHLRGGEPQGDFGLIGGGVVHQHIGNPQTQHRGGNLGI
jgi:hypothetical protein